MRPIILPCLAVLTLSLAPAAHAGGKGKLDCTLTEGKDDRIVQDKDLVLEPGDKVEQAVALRGNVRVKKGARVKDAVAINGSVTLEPGAIVEGDVVAVGGKVHAQEGVQIKGDAIALGGKVRTDKDVRIGGDRMSLQVDIDGVDLVRGFLRNVLHGEHKCRIVKEDGSAASASADVEET